MPHGYFSIEQWRGKKKQWVTVCHVDGHQSVTDAIRVLERRGKPGLFRVTQMQRMIWAEKTNGWLRLRKWNANSPGNALTHGKGI